MHTLAKGASGIAFDFLQRLPQFSTGVQECFAFVDGFDDEFGVPDVIVIEAVDALEFANRSATIHRMNVRVIGANLPRRRGMLPFSRHGVVGGHGRTPVKTERTLRGNSCSGISSRRKPSSGPP